MDQDTKKRSVPKFASFKPKPDAQPQKPSPAPSAPEEKEHHKRERQERHRRDKHSKPHRHHSSSHHRRHQDDDDDRHHQQQPAPSTEEAPLYIVDKRGDPLIVRYGANERSKVPRSYRRAGAGRVMGATAAGARLRLIYDGSRTLFSLGDAGDSSSSAPSVFRDRALLAKAARKKTRVFRLRRCEAGEEEEEEEKKKQRLSPGPDEEKEMDFLPFASRKPPAGGEKELGEGSGDEEGAPNYRSIQGKAKHDDFMDSDLESVDSSDVEGESAFDASDPTRQKSIELSRRVKQHPEDVDAWLELVDLQENLLRLNEDARHDKSDDEVKGLASIRVSLLEEALPHAGKQQDRERLLLRLMSEGARVWSSKALAKRWAEISLKDCGFQLWKAYVDAELASISTFTYDRLKGMHVDRLAYLRKRLSDAVQGSHEENSSREICNICAELVYVFLRATCLIREAGYSELAVALWQAMLELTFARPVEEPETPLNDFLTSFGDFWESEVPRLGETGAKGWRFFTDAEEMADLPEMKTDAAPVVPETRDVYKAWAAVETQRSRNASLPARTLDEGTDEDPFRVVMFADLEPLLFYIPTALFETHSVRASVTSAFLLFCRLPPASTNDMVREMYNDPFVYSEAIVLEAPDDNKRRESDPDEQIKRPPTFSDSNQRLVGSADVMFSGPDWFRFFNRDLSPEYTLALTATAQLATSFGYEPVAEYSLGLAYNKDATAVRKAAKALLKQWPNNTALYNAYAIAEWRNGNRDTANKVLLSATGQGLNETERLWTTWAWLQLEAGDLAKALVCCVTAASPSSTPSIVDSSVVTHSQLLKARQTLSSRREFLLSSGDIHQATLYAEASALLEYLAPLVANEPFRRQGDLQAALTTIGTFTNEAASRPTLANHPRIEHLHQFAAHLYYLHTTRGPYRPAHLRAQLQDSITRFPANTMFPALHAWAADTATTTLLNDPLRALLRRQAAAQLLQTQLFAIRHELRTTATVHSARAAFERALTNSNNAGLWGSYVRFVVSTMLTKDNKKKKEEVYYRAMSACPWSKAVAMEAFGGGLVREMESGELRAVWEAMVAKGLRVCVDLEEFKREWAARDSRRRA